MEIIHVDWVDVYCDYYRINGHSIIIRNFSGKIIDKKNNEYTFKDGKLHSYNDQPAIAEYSNKKFMWYNEGKMHRDNKPAYICKNKVKFYQNDKLHRVGAPAVYTKQKVVFYQNNKIHRDNGPAVIYRNGDYEWRIKNKLHRADNKPAVFYTNLFNKQKILKYVIINHLTLKSDLPKYYVQFNENGKLKFAVIDGLLKIDENRIIIYKSKHVKMIYKFKYCYKEHYLRNVIVR